MSRTIIMDGTGRAPTDFDSIIETELRSVNRSQESIQQQLLQCKQRLLALRTELLPTQLAMLLDPSPKKAEIATRRSGKTYYNRHEAAEKLLDNPWLNRRKAQPVIQYIAPTQKKALDLFWTPFKVLAERIGLYDLIHWDDNNLRATCINGTLVRASGADNKDDLEKYLGDAYVHVIIDEAQSLGPKIEDLIISKLSMAMADYQGTMAMTGTPGPVQAGYFYEIYMGQHTEWSKQPCWTFMDNFHLDLPGKPSTRNEEWIVKNVGPLDSPRVRRECYGEWVSDASSLVYQYSDSRNLWDGPLPAGHDWHYLLGIDVGYRDPAAFVVGAYAKTHPWLFIVHSESHPHMLPSEIETKIADLRMQFTPMQRMVMDTGGSMARNNMEEWNRRSQFGLLPADKPNKYAFIEHMNSEFHLGRIKVLPGLSVVKYWRTLPWEDADTEVAAARHDGRPREHKGFENHECDAALYMFKESRHYRSKDPEPDPLPGTPDYWKKKMLHAKVTALQTAVRNTQQPGFRYGRFRN